MNWRDLEERTPPISLYPVTYKTAEGKIMVIRRPYVKYLKDKYSLIKWLDPTLKNNIY